jgi:hypothetical protein
MRPLSLFPAALLALLVIGFPASAQTTKVSHSPRELGTVVLRELEIRGGKLVFRVDSNGCTDASSFKVRASREEGLSPKVPHYRLVVERVRIDECKAMIWDGVLIELDLDKDLGLAGPCTVTVENPVFPGQGMLPAALPQADSGAELQTSLLRSTMKGIELEIEAEQAGFAGMKPEEYPEPVKERPGSASVFDQPADFGPVLPPVTRDVVVTVDGPLGDSDYGILKTGKRYRLTLCLVYRREDFGLIGDYDVHVVSAR